MWHGSRSVWKRECDMLLEVGSHVIRLFVNSPSRLWKFRRSHLTAQHTSSWLDPRWCHRYHTRSGPDNRWWNWGGGETRLSSIIVLLFHVASLKLSMAPSSVSHRSSSVTSQCNTTDPRAARVNVWLMADFDRNTKVVKYNKRRSTMFILDMLQWQDLERIKKECLMDVFTSQAHSPEEANTRIEKPHRFPKIPHFLLTV